MRYCGAERKSGSYEDRELVLLGDGEVSWEQANAHLEKPGKKEEAAVAIPMCRRISLRSTPCPPKWSLVISLVKTQACLGRVVAFAEKRCQV
jgi:hypothetical protein